MATFFIAESKAGRIRVLRPSGGARPDLKNEVIVPDILIQPHPASMQMMFYTGEQFPAEFEGNVFAAEQVHGTEQNAPAISHSWHREGWRALRRIRGFLSPASLLGMGGSGAGPSASPRPKMARYCSPTMRTAPFGAAKRN